MRNWLRNIIVLILMALIVFGIYKLTLNIAGRICEDGVHACDDQGNCYCYYNFTAGASEACPDCKDFCWERERHVFEADRRGNMCICRCVYDHI